MGGAAKHLQTEEDKSSSQNFTEEIPQDSDHLQKFTHYQDIQDTVFIASPSCRMNPQFQSPKAEIFLNVSICRSNSICSNIHEVLY